MILLIIHYIVNKAATVDSNTTSVAVRQRPRANQPAKSGILPTPPAPPAVGVPATNSRLQQNPGALAPVSGAPIDDGHSRMKPNTSTNPFAQTSAFGPNSLTGAQNSSDVLSSNPFATSSHSGSCFGRAFFRWIDNLSLMASTIYQ